MCSLCVTIGGNSSSMHIHFWMNDDLSSSAPSKWWNVLIDLCSIKQSQHIHIFSKFRITNPVCEYSDLLHFFCWRIHFLPQYLALVKAVVIISCVWVLELSPKCTIHHNVFHIFKCAFLISQVLELLSFTGVGISALSPLFKQTLNLWIFVCACVCLCLISFPQKDLSIMS